MTNRPPCPALNATLLLTMVGTTCSVGLRAQAPSLQQIERRHDQGERDEAIAALARLLEARPRDAEAWLLMARLCNRRGDYVAAERAARRAAELAPGSATASLELGVSLDRRGDQDAAREHLERALDGAGGDVRLFAARAARRAAVGDWDGAVTDYDAALRLAPDSPGLLCGRGRALMGVGEFVLAADAFDQAKARWPPVREGNGTGETNLDSALCCDLARAHYETGAGERALELLLQRLARQPRDVVARLLRVRLATRLGRLELAAADCSALLAMAPDDAVDAVLRQQLGVVWLLRGDDDAAATALLVGGHEASLLRWAMLFAGDAVAARAALPDVVQLAPALRPVFAAARDGELVSPEECAGLGRDARSALAFVAATRAAAAGRELEAEVEWLRAVNAGSFDSPFVDVAVAQLQRRGIRLQPGFGCELTIDAAGALRVTDVVRCGAAAEQGLRAGDRLERIGHYHADQLLWLEQPGHHRVGLETVVVVRRDGEQRRLRLRSGLQPNAAHREFVPPPPAARPH